MRELTTDALPAAIPMPIPLLAERRKSSGDAEWDDPDELIEDELEPEDDDLDDEDDFDDEDEEEFDDEDLEDEDDFEATTSLDELEDEEAYEDENEDWDA